VPHFAQRRPRRRPPRQRFGRRRDPHAHIRVVRECGEGSGERYTIAGYGTTDEGHSGSFGALHEASLVAAASRALVDPNRTGSIGASACFGDSGGPVMRGGILVGIITRAAHPSPPIACGHLTRWAPVTVSGEAGSATADVDEP
jgi:hypothetical protein